MEQYSNYTEFQEIRDQLALLHRKLDREVIMNEKMIRNVVKNNLSSLDNIMWRTIILQLVAAANSWFLFRIGFSGWFCCTTGILLLFAAFYTYIFHRELQTKDFISDALVEICKKTYRLKHRYVNRLKIGMTLLCFWCAWLIWEIQKLSTIDHDSRRFFTNTCIAAIIIGVNIGFYKYRKTLRIMNNILQDIDEFRQEQER